MRRMLVLMALFVATAAAPAAAGGPLVDAAWLKANLGRPDLVVLDVRGSRQAYMAGHIPGAVHTLYGGKKGWRVNTKTVKGVLPEPAYLERLIGGLGIGNDNHVVIVAGGYGAGEMGTATRVYWTFKVVGHDAVSILDGGMTAWLADRKNPLERGWTPPRPTTFTARLRPELLADADDVRQAQASGTLVDNRPTHQFMGINKSGSVKRHGTVPGAKSVPGVWLTRDDGGLFRNAESIKKLYELAGAPTEGATITFCNTGHWASLGWFVSYEVLGNKQTKLYDGSLADWTVDNKNPVERRVTLP